MHTGNGQGSFALLTILDRHHPATVYTPGYLMFVLAGRYTGIALDTTFSITEKFHTCHVRISLSGPADPAQGTLGFLHGGYGVIPVGEGRIAGLPQHVWITPRWILVAQIPALEVATEMERRECDT